MEAAYEDSCIVLKVVKSCHEVTNAKQLEFYVELDWGFRRFTPTSLMLAAGP